MTIIKTEAEPGNRMRAHNNGRASVRMNAGLPKHSEARLHSGPAPALKRPRHREVMMGAAARHPMRTPTGTTLRAG